MADLPIPSWDHTLLRMTSRQLPDPEARPNNRHVPQLEMFICLLGPCRFVTPGNIETVSLSEMECNAWQQWSLADFVSSPEALRSALVRQLLTYERLRGNLPNADPAPFDAKLAGFAPTISSFAYEAARHNDAMAPGSNLVVAVLLGLKLDVGRN